MLPLAVRVPLLAGASVLAVAAATTQVSRWAMDREMARQSRKLGDVYLDGLSAAVLPALRTGDAEALREALGRALGFHEGVLDRRIVVARPDGAPIARVARHKERRGGPPPLEQGLLSPAWATTPDGAFAWAQRPLTDRGRVVALLAAQLDFRPEVERRRRLDLALAALDAALAVLGAAIAACLTRRAQRPVIAVADALGQAAAGRLDSLPPPPDRAAASEAGRLVAAFNGLVACLREREDMAGRLAERERAALLGRLAATLAHEVRNPLAGMLTAVGTARRFGADPAERDVALDLIERGLMQVEAVVRSTLVTHRGAVPSRPMAAADFDDLRVLAEAEARRRGVVLEWTVRLPNAFPVDAMRLRQTILNLLLNAIAATPRGGRVGLDAQMTAGGDELAVSVADAGPGLSPAAVARLHGTGTGDTARGLGLRVVARLVEELSGRLAVDTAPGSGTRVTLRLPAARPAAQAAAA